jgi:signal transduction histidine kinase
LNQIDEDLQRRVAAVSGDVRRRPPFGERGGHPPFGDGPERPPPRFPSPDGSSPRDFREFRPGPREIRLSAQTLSQFDETDTNAYYFAIWSRDGTLVKHSTNAPIAAPVPMRLGADTQPHTRMREPFREAFHFTEMGDCVLVGRAITTDLDTIRRFGLWLFGAGGAVLAFGLGGGWLLATRALRPVEDISVTATRISAGNLSERINVADTDNELGHLASVLNSTFARLEAAFAQQKQFTADASHELRTPLAVIISEAQTSLARERTSAEYRETVEACLDTAQQMRRLTESLLELARLDGSQEPIQRERLDLAETTRSSVERLRPLARQRGLQIQCDLASAEACGNADHLGQVITNLVANAIQYNQPNGEIRVSTRTENGMAILKVADTGVGIAAEEIPHIFERFYRADKSLEDAASSVR